jgi:glycosyltransferase involved in cell wall biosynthesis
MQQAILLSVLITAYNREKYISEAIESILHSSFPHFELIIVDDASTDHTVSIARSFEKNDNRIKVFVNEKNVGDYPNRNIAASYAKGKYLKYVDSDDSIYPHTLQLMVDAMEKFPTAAFGFCDCKPGNYNYPVFYTGSQALRKHFFNKGLLLAGSSNTIIRRNCFEAAGGFSITRYISDYEAWLNLCLNYDVLLLPPNLVKIRLHAGQELDAGKLEYYHLNYNLHKAFISADSCPFSKQEKKKLLFNYKILLGRRLYQRLLKWYGLKKSLQTIKKAGETPALFLWAFMPMKKFDNNHNY